MESLVGGRFVIEREAGAGAMARVYRARDVTTNELVALKVLNSIGDATLRRFDREVSALVDVNHPGIVRYIAHGATTTGQAFLAMEWLAGETLEARLERGPLDTDQTLALGRAVASALAAAHARGLVHRDVKPGNLFLVDGDPAQAKLLDFGLARDTMATFGLTNTGDLLGTPLFMSPEQASCELDVDSRCDVYALGAVLYNCLAGRAPLVAPNLPGLLAKIVLEEPASLINVPRAIAQLVARLLAKKRADRPADGAAAEAALAAAAAGLSQRERTASTLPSREQRVVSILLATNVVEDQSTLDATMGSHGGMLGLADGSTMVVFSGPETPGDLAARAARCALGLRTPSGVVSLATGHAVLSGSMPMGEVIDRASRQLDATPGTVRVDADTVGLIEGRFEIGSDGHGTLLVGERAGELDPVRTLLGKPTRCIGRDRELSAIEGFFAECISESAARAVIVLADAGFGKSRLAHEVQRRLATHSEAPEVLFVRCESITETSPFAAAASAVRRSPRGMADVATDEFLAELVGMPTKTPSDRMRAARANPTLMFDHIRSAWVSWLRRGCATAPVLLVIEDLHWADESSVLLVDAALGALAESPLMVLALARPEVRARRPWAARKPHELRLDPLAKRASERLVRDALGALATDDIVAGILARAEGNALFLEELVRAAANPNVSALPVGVIGTLQLRFDSLRPESRTVLRVASVYGERFARAGIEALVPDQLDIDGALAELTSAELVGRASEDYAFRHALVREAAYAMLPEDDRKLAHALAAAVLVTEAMPDAAVIARHFELGEKHAEAAHWYAQAASHALAHNELSGAISHARLAQQWVHDSVDAGMLDLVIGEAEMWLGHLAAARDATLRATTRIPTGSRAWLHAVALLITSAGQLGDNEAVAAWLARIEAIEAAPDAVEALVQCFTRASSQLAWGDDETAARRALARADALARDHDLGPLTVARLEFTRATAMYLDGLVEPCIRKLVDTSEMYDRVGARRDALQTKLIASTFSTFAGLPGSEAKLQQIIDEATAIEATYIAEWARFEYSLAVMMRGDRDGAKRELAKVPNQVRETPLFLAGLYSVSLWAAFHADDVEELRALLPAAFVIRTASRYLQTFRSFAAYVAFRDGNVDHAVAEARSTIDELYRAPGMKADVQCCGFAVCLTVLARAGTADLQDRLTAYLAHMNGLASSITDETSRRAFLNDLPWNRLVLELRQQTR